MAKCEVCGNDYDMSFQVVTAGVTHTFDSFECAIHKLAPVCSHCGCKIIGHGIERGRILNHMVQYTAASWNSQGVGVRTRLVWSGERRCRQMPFGTSATPHSPLPPIRGSKGTAFVVQGRLSHGATHGQMRGVR